MGLFLVAILLSLTRGPHREGPGWHSTFGWSALIVFVVVAVDWLVARCFPRLEDCEEYDGSPQDVEVLGAPQASYRSGLVEEML